MPDGQSHDDTQMAATSSGHLDNQDLKHASIQQRVDIFLGLGSIDFIPRLNLRDELVFAFEGGEVLVGKFSPLCLNFVSDDFSLLDSWNIFHSSVLQ